MNIRNQLLELQFAQQQHDELAHRDILCLPMKDRIKHMVLLFTKYAGRLAELQVKRDDARLVATLVDTFIICLASANSLSMRLSERLSDTGTEKPQSDLGNLRGLISELPRIALPYLAKITGEMAKACESMDHLEQFDYRATFEQGIEEITDLSLLIAKSLNLDLTDLVRRRWAQVEQKSIFSKEETALHLVMRRYA